MQVTQDPVQPSSSTVRVRTIATLPGFLPERHAMHLFRQDTLIDAPKSIEALQAFWSQFQKRSLLPPKHHIPTVINIQSLPQSLKGFEKELKQRPMYLRHYAGVADYQLQCVPIEHLITPQWYADLDYIDRLTEMVPQPDDWTAALHFAFNEDIGPVMHTATPLNDAAASVIFRSSVGNLVFATPVFEPPVIRSLHEEGYEIAVRVQPRPNYLQVGRIRGKYVIINGVHHIAALWKAGRQYVPCLVRQANQLGELFPPNTAGIIPEVQALARPPYIHDLFDEEVTPRLHQRFMEQALRVVIQSDSFLIPSS